MSKALQMFRICQHSCLVTSCETPDLIHKHFSVDNKVQINTNDSNFGFTHWIEILAFINWPIRWPLMTLSYFKQCHQEPHILTTAPSAPVMVDSSRPGCRLDMSTMTLELSWDPSSSVSVSFVSLFSSVTVEGRGSCCCWCPSCPAGGHSPVWLWSPGGFVSPPALWSSCLDEYRKEKICDRLKSWQRIGIFKFINN